MLAEILPALRRDADLRGVLEGDRQRAVGAHGRDAQRHATPPNDMIQELTLTYNKARQEQITKELLDIVGGVERLKE